MYPGTCGDTDMAVTGRQRRQKVERIEPHQFSGNDSPCLKRQLHDAPTPTSAAAATATNLQSERYALRNL